MKDNDILSKGNKRCYGDMCHSEGSPEELKHENNGSSS